MPMITKRFLGMGLASGSFLAIAALFLRDLLRAAGEFNGIGPLQQIALTVLTITLIIGLTLIPLGNRPA